jgi:hypothetical protein
MALSTEMTRFSMIVIYHHLTPIAPNNMHPNHERPKHTSRDTHSYSIESKNKVAISIQNLKSQLPEILTPKKKIILYKTNQAYDRIKRENISNVS